MTWLRRLTLAGAILLVLALFSAIVPSILDPAPPGEEKRRRDTRWVASSPYWLDRQACRWLGLCGVMHLRWDPAYVSPSHDDGRGCHRNDGDELRQELRRRSGGDEWAAAATVGEAAAAAAAADAAADSDERGRRKTKRETKKEARRAASLREIPTYVLEHAPLVHLFSGEHFWPSDILDHVRHVSPFVEDDPLNATASLSTLDRLNSRTGIVSLRSDDDVEVRPEWLYSETGIPVPFRDPPTEFDLLRPSNPAPAPDPGSPRPAAGPLLDSTWYRVGGDSPLRRLSPPRPRRGGHHHHQKRPLVDPDAAIPLSPPPPPPPVRPPADNSTENEGYSRAPAVLVLVEKAPGILDAFWFFFYSYNLGQTVAALRFGNHVGDWEHCMVRFRDGVPRAVFLSEHEGGQAFSFAAMQRYARWPGRPVVFSAVGSHAMYPLPGRHPYVLPLGMLADETDRGPLWDPAKNTYAYFYDHAADNGDPFGEDDDGDDGADDDNDHDGGVGPGDAEDGVNGQMAQQRLGLRRRRENSNSNSNLDPSPNPSLVPAASNPDAPTGWFHYTGAWGDNLYSLADIRQWRLFMQYHYVTGPRGPKNKNLDRETMCPGSRCRLLDRLDPKGKWY